LITLYYAPQSRASRIIRLLDELGATDRVEIVNVTVKRHDGSGGADQQNPHPEGKVPVLVANGEQVWESSAVIQYLCEAFPGAGLAPMPGEPGRGAYLSWMAWYGDVLEPLMVLSAMGVDHPLVYTTFRDFPAALARIGAALEKGPYLLGDNYSGADLLVVSAFTWNPDAIPDVPAIRDWVARCEARPSSARLAAYEEAALAGQ